MRIVTMGLNSRFGEEFYIDRYWTRDYLLLHFKTPAIVVIDGKEEYAKAGSVIIYHVNTQQHYKACEQTYIDDFIHFYMDNDYQFFTDLEIPFNKLLHLPETNSFSNLLKQIYLEFLSNSKHREITTDLLMKLLFTKLSELISKDNLNENYYGYYDKLHKLRANIYDQPEKQWSVDEMAKICNLSPSYFQILYKQAFGITCINDVINSKIQHSKSLLAKTNYPIKEVALLCGYKNNEYFMRQFKKCTGYTPSQYRKDYMNDK